MKTPFLPSTWGRAWLKSSGRMLATALLLGSAQQAYAQFPRNETFKGSSANNFTISGAAKLTGTGQAGDDAVGQGYLRLTGNAPNVAGYAIDNVGFNAPDGFTISFEFFAYGGTGADGFSVFLVDEDQPVTGFRIGATGGSLGYAQKTIAPIADGASRGYIGIGIDEFGNFSNPTEGRVGGPGFIADAVSVRGPGDGRSATDYPYLGGTILNELGFSLDVPTARAQAGSPDYRRAFIDVVPTGSGATRTYDITVRIQHGSSVTTAVKQLQVSTPPSRLRLGFSGSTGGSTNAHEIRNLNIVQAPFAVDDVASTIYNTPVAFSVTSNDVAPGSSIDRATVDLDIDAPGIQSTRTIASQGTFAVNSSGAVTFTPVSTFAGTVTLPYTVQDILSQTSSPANITVIVEGADMATSVSGPNFATSSSRVTYTVTTRNLGTQPATNVVPTLRLSPSVSSTGMTLPSGAVYNAATGVISFSAISNLAAGSAAVVNSVSFNLPASGTLLGTATTTTDTPDPVTSNNTATITTTIGGTINVVTSCATPGKDGPATLAAGAIPDTYFPAPSATGLTNNLTAIAAGATSIPVGAALSTTGATAISAGDLVLIMQMQGLDINTTDSPSYGIPSINNSFSVGKYEYAIATNSVPLSGGTLTIAQGLINAYKNEDYDSTTSTGHGQRRYQVVRVPQYSALTITGAVTGAAWDGRAGGILALDVAGQTTMSGASAGLNMNAKGFRGGAGKQYLGSTASTYANTIYRNQALIGTGAAHGGKGEGTAGAPQHVFLGGTATFDYRTLEGYLEGSVGRGAPGNAGGGANDFTPATNSGNAGGAGGGNAGAGGFGGYGFGSAATGARAIGGAVQSNSAALLTMGGGGGAGSTNVTTATDGYLSSGGIGGGIIMLRTGFVSGTGTVQAAGGNAPGTTADDGGGGGGAGGTILLLATPPTGSSNGLNGLTVSAPGGQGGNANAGGPDSYGPGGGGGGGFVYANGTLASTATVTGGTPGVTNGTITYGALAGAAGVTTINTDATTNDGSIAGAGACLPILTASLETSTAQVTRTGDPGQPVNPASYTLRIVNTGGIANDVSTIIALATNGVSGTYGPFRFQAQGATVQRRLADGTLTMLTPEVDYTAPINQSITPTFSGLTLPAGATLIFNFQTTIEGGVQDNLAYQSAAQVRYSDPTRTSATRTISPTQFYEAGGEVPGANYAGTSSTAEDVTVARPLPVELKRFDVAAVSLNAELSWITASELQNDHFNIERSLDGRSFERIGTVRGQGTATHETSYRYTDINAGRLSLKPIYYRLRQVDKDGTSSFSPVRMVRFVRGANAAIALYPNPHTGTATLDLTALASMDYSVEVLDLAGRQIRRFQLAGGLEHALQLHTLPLGSYLIRVRSAETVITLPMIRN